MNPAGNAGLQAPKQKASRPKTVVPKIVGKNTVGRHSGLTALFPIRSGTFDATSTRSDQSIEGSLKSLLRSAPRDEQSPFADVPDTYFARLLILTNLVAQPVCYSVATRTVAGFVTRPWNWIRARMSPKAVVGVGELQSRYLVWTLDVHGPIETYLGHLWANQEPFVRSVFSHCYGFDKVSDISSFVSYVNECQVDNALLFMGSTDEPVAEQLKGLFLKQQFAEFVATHQTPETRANVWVDFQQFCRDTQPENIDGPTWRRGATTLNNAYATSLATATELGMEQE
jgi:hypothetical protein